jgi:hypothetical protein
VIGPVRKETSQKLDSGEMIEVVEVPLSEIPRMLTGGTINHALIMNAFYGLAMRSPEMGRLLAEELSSFRRGSRGDSGSHGHR